MQLKIRAWDEEIKKYYRNPGNEEDLLFGIGADNKIFICNPETNTELQPLLFTGIKDKNGNEIYEGDTLQDIIINRNSFGNCEVCFDEGSFYLKHKDGYLLFVMLRGCPNVCIIGNKFEHPELLEQKT